MARKAFSIGLTVLLLAGCNEHVTDPPAEPDAGVDAEIGVVLDRRAPSQHVLHKLFSNAQRQPITDAIVHYSFDVRLGTGPFDVVRIHRVVRERRPHRPIRTDGAVFMTHGASLDFEAIFLHAGTQQPNAETSVAVYLAANGIDVWGMDFAWTKVPLETTDFSFMREWGVQRDADHTLAAMSVARLIRGLTRQGFGRMNLLGYSYGVGVAYAAAGRETQQPHFLRDIRGIVAVDQAMKFSVESARIASCVAAADLQALIDAGQYQDPSGLDFGFLGSLAATAPDDPSPAIPGFTNYQALLFVGINTFVISPGPAPFFHFVGGVSDANGVPQDLRYADPERWIVLAGSLPPYMPNRAPYDVRASQCDEDDVAIDDHLSDISVPILYLSAEGGFSTLGQHTATLTASDDVTNVNIQVLPDGQTAIDYGHADLFLGDDAPDLVWSELQEWLVDHSGRGARRFGDLARDSR